MATNAYNLEHFVRILESWGLSDVLLPFLLIFVIIFALMQKTKVLGNEKKRMNSVVAMVMALLVVIPHVLRYDQFDVVPIINKALPQVSIILVAVVMLLLIISLFGGEAVWGATSLSGWVAIVAALTVLYLFGAAAHWWDGWSWFDTVFGTDAMAIFIMLLVFAAIIWFVTKGESKGEKMDSGLAKVGEGFGKLFGGKK